MLGHGSRREDVVAITAAMMHPVGLDRFEQRFPERTFDVGIAEQHAATSAAGLAMENEFEGSVVKILEWLDKCQIRENPRHYHTSYRHATKGAWPFSTKTQGYTVSDCTGEGLKAVLYIQEHVK